ncbi:DMT family transporter [Helicobacter labetoulli]|uniref:DMT family transporter n=1 Tax=Helicobacter labetoulli TaxID=2315333 RepID=UPI000EF6FB2D|nr:DMT family transporter [Helicobacter labetoulli]
MEVVRVILDSVLKFCQIHKKQNIIQTPQLVANHSQTPHFLTSPLSPIPNLANTEFNPTDSNGLKTQTLESSQQNKPQNIKKPPKLPKLPQSPSFFIILALLAESFIIYASVLVKLTDMSPINLGFYRIALALPVFWLMANTRRNVFKIPLKDIAFMMLAGIFFAFDLLFFNIALRHTSVANVNLFASLACFILMPIGIFFFKERFKKSLLIGAIVAFVGIFILVGGKGELSVATPFGDFMAFLSVLCYSCFLGVIYSLRKRYGTLEIMFFACIGSSLMLLALALIFEGFEVPKDMRDFGIIALIALCGQVIGQGFFNYILGKVNTQTSSILLLFSPIIAALMGFFILGEKLGMFEILGIFVIIFGVFVAKRENY